MDESQESQLVGEAIRGSRAAFAALLERYEKPVFNAAFRILGDFEDARDVTQSTFLKAYENLETFDEKYRFFSWIYRIAINEALNLRKTRDRLEVIEDLVAEEHDNPESAAYQTELNQSVHEGLMKLGLDYRMVIVLKHFNDFNYRDISEVLGIPEKTVKSRLFTARSILQEDLSKRGIL